ncbi:MAG: hypothetical protein COW04_04000, partial [Deltaproteobacteria bacterium CG12_big_fil_rev_8_21_14_0_65_43_10]
MILFGFLLRPYKYPVPDFRSFSLSRRDNISSTEKLLDMIRGDKPAVSQPAENSSESVSPKKQSSILRKIWPSGKGITVGIDFAYTNLKLVKIKQTSENQWKLLGCTDVPFDPEIPKESPEFSRFLKGTLSDFAGASGKFDIWCLMSAAQMEIRHIRIPKVPKKQIANAVYWTFKREVDFDESENILDFEVIGDISEEGVQKISTTVYTAPKQEIKRLKDLFSRSGFPLTGISIGPFAAQNLLRTGWMETGDKTVASLYVGRNWSRIDIFSSGNLVLARGIKAGMNSMMESILEDANESQNEISIEVVEEGNASSPVTVDREGPIDMAQAKRILSSLSPDSSPLTEAEPGFYLKDEEIFRMILPALERLVRQVERSFEYCALNLKTDKVGRILIAGQIHIFTKPVLDYISEQVGVPCDINDPLQSGEAFLNDVLTPDRVSERIAFGPALGMALSSRSRTPNLIFTYREKDKLESVTRINRSIFIEFLFILAVCTGVFYWQGKEIEKRKAKITGLEQEIEKYNPRLNKDLILQWAGTANEKSRQLKAYGHKYLLMATISELSHITPSDIRLLNFTGELGSDTKDNKKSSPKILLLEGIIYGEPAKFDDALAMYLMQLEGSPLFSEI